MILQPNFENETTLVCEISKGNEDAFHYLVKKYKQSVGRFARKMFQAYGAYQTGIEDDIMQDVFMKVYQNISRFNSDTGTSLKTWLLSTTRNEVSNKLKRKVYVSLDTKTSSVLDGDNFKEINDIILSYKQNVEGKINYEQSKLMINQAIEKLNPPFRETMKAFVDSDFEASMEELSIMFKVSEGTIKSRLSRARETLTPILEPLKFILMGKVGK
jgi:RNA polymerase sigma-70 factor (ECF subfamily)